MSGRTLRYACSLADLAAAQGRKAVTLGAREIVVVRADGEVFAVDRACPHEGYALEEGRVEGTTLTCLWHGWRFDLRSGACLTVGEDVRSYEVAVEDGDVYVDVDVEASPQERSSVAEALLSALETGRASLAARRTARLLGLGESPQRVALLLARYGATHADEGLDPETAAVADVVDLLPYLDARGTVLVLADVASALAERLARATPRFGPEPAGRLAWVEAGVGGTLAALVRAGDADEAEAVVAGMVAADVPLRDVAAGLAEGVVARFRGAWPLVVLERAVRLADLLGPEAARVLLPVAAYGCAAAQDKEDREPFRSGLAALRSGSGDGGAAGEGPGPDDVLEECGRILATFNTAFDSRSTGTGSLLGCGLALAHAGAAAWAVELLGDEGRPALLHARALAAARTGPSTARESDLDVPPGGLAAALVDGPADTARGLAVCLAAARTALLVGGPRAEQGAYRLLVTPKRERFTSRYIEGGTTVVFEERA